MSDFRKEQERNLMRAIEAVRNGSATNGGISNARDRLRERAQNEQTSIALNNLLNETQKNAMVLVEDNARLRAQVATLTAELDNKRRLFESCDAAHTELTEQYLEVTRELARVKALVAGSQTVGYYVYVSEHQNAYIVEDADEAIDDLTNHGAQITELIARPNLNLEQKP